MLVKECLERIMEPEFIEELEAMASINDWEGIAAAVVNSYVREINREIEKRTAKEREND
jgi:hypothetical protein